MHPLISRLPGRGGNLQAGGRIVLCFPDAVSLPFRTRLRLRYGDGTVMLGAENTVRARAKGAAAGVVEESKFLNDHNLRNGMARPSNVIETRAETNTNGHSVPFPVALPEFFVKAFAGLQA